MQLHMDYKELKKARVIRQFLRHILWGVWLTRGSCLSQGGVLIPIPERRAYPKEGGGLSGGFSYYQRTLRCSAGSCALPVSHDVGNRNGCDVHSATFTPTLAKLTVGRRQLLEAVLPTLPHAGQCKNRQCPEQLTDSFRLSVMSHCSSA